MDTDYELLADFRRRASETEKLPVDQRRAIVSTARDLMQDFYVHGPLKRAMYGADPVGPLDVLGQRLAPLTPREFHDEMLAIFADLRDRHSVYVVPPPYRDVLATIGIRIQEAVDDDRRRYLITQVADDVASACPALEQGAEVTHFNDVPISRAIELNARQTGGGSPEAYHARGLQLL